MNFRDFLDLADELSDGDGEAHWRTSASRACYAAFHVARDLFRELGFAVPRKDAHEYLIRRLYNCRHPEVASQARQLGELREWRAAADYDGALPIHRATAYRAAARGREVVRLLDEVAANPTVRDRVTQAMRDYERDVLKEVTWRGPTP